jgi:hypothetical protein
MDIYKCPKMDFGFSIGGKNREIYPLLGKVEQNPLSRFLTILFGF